MTAVWCLTADQMACMQPEVADWGDWGGERQYIPLCDFDCL